jgi:four helix bundle protein
MHRIASLVASPVGASSPPRRAAHRIVPGARRAGEGRRAAAQMRGGESARDGDGARHDPCASTALEATTTPPTGGSPTRRMQMFDVMEMSITVMERIANVESKVRTKRKSLADQMGRAAESIGLCVSEGRERAGLDRADLYRKAAGSASELTTAMRIAVVRKYITQADFDHVDAALDRVRAMLWRLTH